MSINVCDVTKQYGPKKAVDGIRFSVQKGEIVGFLGPNGAGKSTTMKMITGYLRPDSGTIRVGNVDVAESPIAAKKMIGYLPESNPLYLDMYIREYLGFIADVHRLRNKKERIENIIAQVGLSSEAHKKAGQLSKGYKQRVGLAAALLHDPEVLILDEPTTGLDPNQIIEIREVIRTLGKEKTILFSSHILQEVEALCQRVVIIHQGKLVADDTVHNLLQAPSENEIILEIKEEVEANVFSQMADPLRINATTWRFLSADPEMLKRKLMELSLRHPFEIVSLQSGKSGSLEKLFQQLTRGETSNSHKIAD